MSAASFEFGDSDDELVDFAVNQGNGVTGLSKLGLKTLPKQYIFPPEERLDKTQLAEEDSIIPIIDVSNWGDTEVESAICEAAGKWGFFQIINHGIPADVLESVQLAGCRFFDLPNEERKKYLAGYSPTPTVQLKTSFNPSAEKVLEWKDYLMHFYVPGDEGSKFWPPVSKDQVLEYMKLAKPLIRKLLEVLLKGLKVKEFDEKMESQLMGSPVITLINYPACPNPELACGVSHHSDISSITVLLQDDVGGLYVRETRANQWIHVTPVKGALVINIGDVLQMVSNDRYKSIEHRVAVDGRRNRISVPIFANPARDAIVGPLTEVLENGEKPIYKHIRYLEYFNYFFGKAHDGKQTIEIAKV